MRHLSDIENCKSVLVYEDSLEEYTAFLTPEAVNALDDYFSQRIKDGEPITPSSPIFRKKYILGNQPVKHISYKGLWNTVHRIVTKAKIRDVDTKRNNRYSKTN